MKDLIFKTRRKVGKIKRKVFHHSNTKKLLTLKNKHVGERCFVIGNGPSLSINDLDKLKNEVSFAANKIYLAFDQTDWRPTYYCVEDHLVLQQNLKEINNLQGMIKLIPEAMNNWVLGIKGAIFYNLLWSDFYPDFPKFGIDALETLYWGSTVIYSMMQLACFMGIRDIYLIGVDFNFNIPENVKQNGIELTSTGEINHFHPNYRKPGEKWHVPNLHVQEKSFGSAKSEIQKLGGCIYNATRGGKLEVFPRVDFDKIIASYNE